MTREDIKQLDLLLIELKGQLDIVEDFDIEYDILYDIKRLEGAKEEGIKNIRELLEEVSDSCSNRFS